MDNSISYLAIDGDNISKTVDENLPALVAAGFNEETNTELKAQLVELDKKEKAQSQAVNTSEKATAVKQSLEDTGRQLVKIVRNAVRSAFPDNEEMERDFKLDEEIPRSVTGFCAYIEYLLPHIEEHKAQLIKKGLTQPEIDELGTIAGKIRAAEVEQERTHKAQKAATLLRNDAARVVKAQIKGIRNFVALKFPNKPELVVLFEPTKKGRGTAGDDAKDDNADDNSDSNNTGNGSSTDQKK